MSAKEEFEKWAKDKGFDVLPAQSWRCFTYHSATTEDVWRTWQARQTEIDALKAELELRSEEAIKGCNYAAQLRQAAEEAKQLLANLLDDYQIEDLPGLRIEVTDIKENLRAALDGNLDKVLERVSISEEHRERLKKECAE